MSTFAERCPFCVCLHRANEVTASDESQRRKLLCDHTSGHIFRQFAWSPFVNVHWATRKISTRVASLSNDRENKPTHLEHSRTISVKAFHVCSLHIAASLWIQHVTAHGQAAEMTLWVRAGNGIIAAQWKIMQVMASRIWCSLLNNSRPLCVHRWSNIVMEIARVFSYFDLLFKEQLPSELSVNRSTDRVCIVAAHKS